MLVTNTGWLDGAIKPHPLQNQPSKLSCNKKKSLGAWVEASGFLLYTEAYESFIQFLTMKEFSTELLVTNFSMGQMYKCFTVGAYI